MEGVIYHFFTLCVSQPTKLIFYLKVAPIALALLVWSLTQCCKNDILHPPLAKSRNLKVKINEIEIKGEINEAMNIKIDNYKVLFNLRILKSILTSFVDSFLVLYFLEVLDHNILPLGIYKLITVITIYAVIFATRNLAKSTHRVNLMRIGILLDFV